MDTIGRRGFFRLATGALGLAATMGIPKTLLAPATRRISEWRFSWKVISRTPQLIIGEVTIEGEGWERFGPILVKAEPVAAWLERQDGGLTHETTKK